jgi:hypothetical protein
MCNSKYTGLHCKGSKSCISIKHKVIYFSVRIEVRDHKAFCCQYHPSIIKLLVELSFYIQRILDTSYVVLKVRICGSEHNRPYCNQYTGACHGTGHIHV